MSTKIPHRVFDTTFHARDARTNPPRSRRRCRALLGTVTSLLATAAAFGAARLIFQDGHGSGLFGFTPQGFLDNWAPVFFFAMIFAIAMGYTVFLLSSAKEHYERTGDPHQAMTGSLAHSGRVIFAAAAAVMVAVFLTFALSGPLPPKEMWASCSAARSCSTPPWSASSCSRSCCA